jgi:hypothetical protein
MSMTRSSIGTGFFRCARCASRQAFVHWAVSSPLAVPRVQMARALAVVGLPARMPFQGQYVECQKCQSTYDADILAPSTWVKEPEYYWVCLRVMLLVVLADGVIADAEIDTVIRLYGETCGITLTRERVHAEILNARASRANLEEVLREASVKLNDACKQIVLRAASVVAAADGVFQQEEIELITRAGDALAMSRQTVKTTVDRVVRVAFPPGYLPGNDASA